jgi:hypothetical protein
MQHFMHKQRRVWMRNRSKAYRTLGHTSRWGVLKRGEVEKGAIMQTASSVAPSGHINSVQNHGGRLQKTKQYMQ